MLQKIKETAIHGMVYGVGQTLSQAVGFLLIPLYTSQLATGEYGVYALLNISMTVLVALFRLGLSSALFRSYYHYDSEEKRTIVVSTTFYTMLCSAIVLAILGWRGASLWSRVIFGEAGYEKLCMYTFFTAALLVMEAIPFAVYRARMMSKRYIFFTVVFLTLRLSLIVYFVAYKHFGVWGIVLGNFLGSVCSATILNLSILKWLRVPYSIPEAKKLLRFGVPLVVVSSGTIILNMADRYFLRIFSTQEQVGLYHLGYQIGMVLFLLLVQPLNLIWPPMLFSAAKEPYAKDYYSKMLTYVVLLCCFMWLGLSMLSRDVLIVMTPPEYWVAYKVVPLVCFAYVLFAAHRVLNVGIALSGKTEYLALSFLLGAVFNLFMNTMLIPKYGRMGAAYATVSSFAVLCFIRYYIARRFYYVPYEWGRLVKILGVSFFLYALSIRIPPTPIVLSIVLKLILALLFPILLYFVRFYYPEEIYQTRIYIKYQLELLIKRMKRVKSS